MILCMFYRMYYSPPMYESARIYTIPDFLCWLRFPHPRCTLFMISQLKTSQISPRFYNLPITAKTSIGQIPALCQTVLKYNIHNLCNNLNPSAAPKNNNLCSKRFFKAFLEKSGRIETQNYLTYWQKSPDASCKTALWIYCFLTGSLFTGLVENFG